MDESSAVTVGFVSYYWQLVKRFGCNLWKEALKDLIIASLLAVFSGFGTWLFHLEGAWAATKVGLFSVAGWYSVTALWHLIQTPWHHYKEAKSVKEPEPSWKFGLFAVVIILFMFGGSVVVGWLSLWHEVAISKIEMKIPPFPTPPAPEIRPSLLTTSKEKPCPTRPIQIVNPEAPQNEIRNCVVAERQFPAQMYIARNDVQAKNMLILMRAIAFLGIDDAFRRNCHIRITAPKEGDETAETIRVAADNLRCRVDYTAGYDLQPEIEEEALQGSINNAVIIHAPKGNPGTEDFVQSMNQLLCVKRKYDLYHDGKPDQAVWLQIGRGFPWHIQSTGGSYWGTPPPVPSCGG